MAKTIEKSAAVTEEVRDLFPAVMQLSAALEKYRQANVEISVFEGKLARLERDESEVLNDIGADEESQVKRLGEVRIRKDVQTRRTAHQREAVSKALAALEATIGPATGELSAAVTLELSRRQELLLERVVKVLGLTDSDWEAKSFIFRPVDASPLLRVIGTCTPAQNAFSPISVEAKASDLLQKFERLEAELGKSI